MMYTYFSRQLYTNFEHVNKVHACLLLFDSVVDDGGLFYGVEKRFTLTMADIFAFPYPHPKRCETIEKEGNRLKEKKRGASKFCTL